MNKVYLALGSDRGDREKHLSTAIKLLEEKAGKVKRVSTIYETQPWQMDDDTPFLNQVILIETNLSSSDLMDTIIRIEEQMGRIREKKTRYEPRSIDIDILFYNNDEIETASLIVPHPQMPNRRFVLEPLVEIAPDYIHPVLKKTIKQLLLECADKHSASKFVSK